MALSQILRGLLTLGLVVAVLHWLGVASVGVGLLAFVLYELFNPPHRYRRFGPGQIQQAVDTRLGRFGQSYREDEPHREFVPKVGRNDPCPCGSHMKFKKCCGGAPNSP
jgi:hypothetical protein